MHDALQEGKKKYDHEKKEMRSEYRKSSKKFYKEIVKRKL